MAVGRLAFALSASSASSVSRMEDTPGVRARATPARARIRVRLPNMLPVNVLAVWCKRAGVRRTRLAPKMPKGVVAGGAADSPPAGEGRASHWAGASTPIRARKRRGTMSGLVQLLLRTALAIQEFLVAHPGGTPGFEAAVAKLGVLIDTIRALAKDREEGASRTQKAVDRATQLRREIRRFMLQPIAALAQSVFRGQPGRLREFKMVRWASRSKEDFLAKGRAIHGAVVADLARFVELGMDPALPDALAEALDEFAALPAQVNAGKRVRTGARDGIEKAADDIMDLFHRLDGLMRFRYRNEPALLAEWQLVRNIPWPNSAKARAQKGEGKAEVKASGR